MADKKKRVVKYRKKHNINVGIVIFAIIFIYMVSYVIMYMTRDKIAIYEVVFGKDAEASNKTYNAVLLRDETIYKSPSSGYLNLFVREGEKTSVDKTVYSIDESGRIKDLLLNAANDENTLTKSDLETIKNKIVTYSTSFEEKDFLSVYDFKGDVEASVMELINLNTIENMDDILGDNQTSNVFKAIKADKSGIVSYIIDGYEDKKVENINAALFDKSKYSKSTHKSSDLVEQGTSIYKVVNSESWNVVFELTAQDAEKYKDDDVMKIKFMQDGVVAVGDFAMKEVDGKTYGIVTLEQYMINYLDYRFTDIQIVEEHIEGLKIPKTSLVEKEFYTIPIEYATEGGNSTDMGFLLEVYDENGNITTKFVTTEIYHKTDTEYYVAKEIFEAGNILLKPNSTDTYVISNIATLQGVYNINNGYCIFREINIIGETSEYYIVESGTTYGLLVYDHIVLDSSKVSEDQIVYQ